MTRRHAAIALTATGVGLTTSGAYVQLGAGAAMLTAGCLVIALALLLGWNA